LKQTVIRLNPLIEILRNTPGRINKILVQRERGPQKIAEVIRLARLKDIPFVSVPRHKLDQLAPGHQGAAAFLLPKEFSSLEDILARSRNPFLVLLDEVEDPQNLGAIIRSAEGAGADGLIIPARHSAGLTGTVLSVSSGAAEHLKIARVTNLAQTMEELKRHGIWLVGAEAGERELWYQFDYTIPIGIVLGSEGRGLRRLVKEKCDKLLSIPLFGRLNSLNVAAAAAIFFFEVVRQRTARNT